MLVKYSRPFKSYPFNVISLSKSFSEQLVKEKVYLVIEAYFNFSLNKPSAVRRISYRIIDEGGHRQFTKLTVLKSFQGT